MAPDDDRSSGARTRTFVPSAAPDAQPSAEDPAEADADGSLPAAAPGRYEQAKMLGRGASGDVYAARDAVLRRDVAVKVLATDADAESLRRFVKEAQITGALDHPGIPPIYDLFVDEDGT